MRAAQAGHTLAKSEPVSLTPAPRADQRRVFWLFIFSFLLVLVYGGCAKRTDPRFAKAEAERTNLRHTFLPRNPTNLPAN